MTKTTLILTGHEIKKLVAVGDFVDYSTGAVSITTTDNSVRACGTDGQIAVDVQIDVLGDDTLKNNIFLGQESIKELKKSTRLKKSEKQEFSITFDHAGKKWSMEEYSGNLEWHDLFDVNKFIGPHKTIHPVSGWYNAQLLGLISKVNTTMGYLDEFWVIGSILDPDTTKKIEEDHGVKRPSRLFATREGWRVVSVSNDKRRGDEVNGYTISQRLAPL